MDKIYTLKGDTGKTSFYTGELVKKSDPHIHAVGSIDELNSLIGLVISTINTNPANPPAKEIQEILHHLQNDLFTVGAELTMLSSKKAKPRITSKHIQEMESYIDAIQEKLSEQKNFIIPGGTLLSAWLHFSRTVARRAERDLVELSNSINLNPELLKYLNRISDLLYVMARYANKEIHAEQQPIYKYLDENPEE
ncbi:cob(I)yrinic acid a,c-diamide adenosyltransferase [Candidatus Woesearchaeota archaeon]|nr:cob(I)yrinic acid a,c-diamide adenosyltransferase [Candidatus Woesearchaeota archaeon]